jgi:hypothetical protein
MCNQLIWNEQEVEEVHRLIVENYGFKMFLDDLPSATLINQIYSDNVPLGYIVYGKSNQVVIFNHFEIKVLVHPSLLTAYKVSTEDDESVTIPVYGTDGVKINRPKNSYRIVGFEVVPKSLKNACSSET